MCAETKKWLFIISITIYYCLHSTYNRKRVKNQLKYSMSRIVSRIWTRVMLLAPWPDVLLEVIPIIQAEAWLVCAAIIMMYEKSILLCYYIYTRSIYTLYSIYIYVLIFPPTWYSSSIYSNWRPSVDMNYPYYKHYFTLGHCCGSGSVQCTTVFDNN